MAFIVEWLDYVRRYKVLVPTNLYFPDSMKKSMLHNAVQEHPGFKHVHTMEQLHVAQGTGPLGYEAYVLLLQRVAAQHDRSLTGIHCRAYFTQQSIGYGQDNLSVSDDLPTDAFGSFLVHATSLSRPSHGQHRPALPEEVWQGLSREDQVAWDQILDVSKRAIMFAYATGKDSLQKDHSSPTSRTVASFPSQQQVRTAETQEATSPAPISDPDPHLEHDDGDASGNQTQLVNQATSRSPIDPADIRNVLSSAATGKRSVSMAETHHMDHVPVHYQVSTGRRTTLQSRHSLIDCGANGGIAGDNVRIIATTGRRVNISGLDQHELQDLPIVTAGGVVPTQQGDVVVILHQYASLPGGQTIHSSPQLEHFQIKVDDKAIAIGGTQSITTLDGYVFPLDIINGLALSLIHI